jgi:sirohydrochlorin cobaltochelatase
MRCMTDTRSPALLLFAHGSRDPSWREPLDAVCQRIAVQYPGHCELAFLEFMQPELSDALQALAQEGEQSIVVVPLFWASGKHIKTDLNEAIDRFSQAHPNVTVQVSTALGEATAVQAALVDYALSCAAMTSKL